MINLLVTNYRPFLNGSAGLSLVPAPLQGKYDPQGAGYQWAYAAITLLLAAGAFWLVQRVTESPYGRSLRAMRDNDVVADSLGKNLLAQRTSVLVLGGALAGLSGGILVSYITTWSPPAWGYAETIVLFAAVIIGGAGNHRGAILGAILVPVGFEEATRYLPAFGPPGFIDDLQWVAIGLLVLIFLWFRPQGILPERRRIIGSTAPLTDMPNEDVVSLPGTRPAPPRADEPRGSPRSGPVRPGVRHADGADVVLRTVDLVRDFGGVHAVAAVSIEVRRGTLTGLIGPNGAGKSTLLGMLAGTIRVTSGQVIYQGSDVTGVPAYRRARLGLVRTFQLASEFKRLTVMENLLSAVPGNRGDSLAGSLRGRRYWRRDEDAAIARARVLLERFGLSGYADTYAGDLSGGQRRLTEIMRALMTEPAMLLLDEPMAGVHPRLARQIGAQLLDLCAEGMTILMVEHEPAIMDEFCDPVIMMAEGAVLATGTMTDLRARTEVVEAYLVG
jgi:ABC-type branched-subunit amino acid transport system ATPase component